MVGGLASAWHVCCEHSVAIYLDPRLPSGLLATLIRVSGLLLVLLLAVLYFLRSQLLRFLHLKQRYSETSLNAVPV